jgi:predicted MFS family arabinose efflux permease
MLVGSVPDAARPRVEGYGEVAMSLAAGGGAPLAGVLASSGGFAALCLAAAAVGLAALTAVWQGAAERPAAGSGVSA